MMRLAGRITLAIATIMPTIAFASADVVTLPRNLSPWGMFLGADIVVQAVIVGLAFASLVTWTVWLAKSIEIQQAATKARRRMMQLDEAALAVLAPVSSGERDAIGQLVQAAAHECRLSIGLADDGLKERIALRLDRVEQALARRIARGTGVLATIGATAPFVGLFGTVWGIMNAFVGISEARTTNLAVVAPGIAEALLATALGLVAAIPAVVIYNQLVRAVTDYRALLGDASTTILLIASRDSDRRAARIAQAAA